MLSAGLPQQHAYDLIYRHELAIDWASGGVWISEDGGERWMAPEERLPPVSAVRFKA